MKVTKNETGNSICFHVNNKGNELHIENVVKSLHKSKSCIVVTGAGISVTGGIPVNISFLQVDA